MNGRIEASLARRSTRRGPTAPTRATPSSAKSSSSRDGARPGTNSFCKELRRDDVLQSERVVTAAAVTRGWTRVVHGPYPDNTTVARALEANAYTRATAFREETLA